MKQEILAILRSGARRLLWVRAAESAAVLVVAAGLGAACLETAWAIVRLHPVPAAAIAALPAVLGIALPASSRVRSVLNLDRGMTLLAACLLAVMGAAGVLCVLADWHRQLDKAAIPLILLPAGAVLGAGAALVRGLSVTDAAIYLDARWRLKERLSTAAELAASPGAEDPPARCVYEQAMEAVRRSDALWLPLWRRTRATAGTTGLAVLLATTLAFLPTLGLSSADESAERLAEALKEFTPAQRRQLAEAFRQAARQPGTDPSLASRLDQTAKVIELKDVEQFKQAMAELQKAGIDPSRLVPADLRALAGLGGAGPGKGPPGDQARAAKGGNAGAGNAVTKPGPTTAGGTTAQPGGSYVRVFDPQYAKLLTGAAPAGGNGSSADEGAAPYADAWTHAKRVALDHLGKGRVPAEYRQLVRDFFSIEE